MDDMAEKASKSRSSEIDSDRDCRIRGPSMISHSSPRNCSSSSSVEMNAPAQVRLWPSLLPKGKRRFSSKIENALHKQDVVHTMMMKRASDDGDEKVHTDLRKRGTPE